MRFGSNKEQADAQPSRGGGGGAFIKYPRAGENQIRIVDEPSDWIYYWEHFNPNGYSFPCVEDDRANCPGCTSDNDKMKKASQKVAFNALSQYEGKTYLNVWKVPRTSVADKLETRAQRNGTITDRDFLITQRKNANRVEYDVEGLDKEPMDFTEFMENHTHPGVLLEQAFNDEWGNGGNAQETSNLGAAAKKSANDSPPWKTEDEKPKSRIQRSEPKPPAEEKVVTEDELRKMDVFELQTLCKQEGFGDIPPGTDSPDEIVDWMLTQ